MRPGVGRGGGRGSHKGGAWKVAYADFITALMSLFIVLWLLNSTKIVRDNVTRYFRDPRATATKSGSTGTGPGALRLTGSATGIALEKKNIRELQQLLERALKQLPEFEHVKKHVRITVTGEGLRIELLETDAGMFFESGNPTPTPAGQHLLELLARELGRLPNSIIMEGHTDARPYRNENLTGYSNWDLSLDRANAARKAMESYGLRPDQVGQVRGFSDRKPLADARPDSDRNRRISVTVVYWSDEVTGSRQPSL